MLCERNLEKYSQKRLYSLIHHFTYLRTLNIVEFKGFELRINVFNSNIEKRSVRTNIKRAIIRAKQKIERLKDVKKYCDVSLSILSFHLILELFEDVERHINLNNLRVSDPFIFDYDPEDYRVDDWEEYADNITDHLIINIDIPLVSLFGFKGKIIGVLEHLIWIRKYLENRREICENNIIFTEMRKEIKQIIYAIKSLFGDRKKSVKEIKKELRKNIAFHYIDTYNTLESSNIAQLINQNFDALITEKQKILYFTEHQIRAYKYWYSQK